MEDGGDVSAASAGAGSSGDVPAASAGADAFEDEVDLEIGEEQRKAIVKKEPHQPSQAEVDEHESTGHVVHRSWCLHCKRARVTADRHVPKELDEPETQLPTLSLDYFYMNQDQVADEATLPSIVAKCHKTKRFWASVLPGKGADAFAIAWLGGVLDDAGFNKVILKSDGEPSLVSLKQKVKEIKTHIEVHLVETPVEDHQANGFIEVGVREIKRQCRALLSDLEFKLERKVDPGHPLLVWLPRHAAFLLTRYRVGTDGKTAFERTYGRKWRIPLVRFGESILYRPRANRGGKRNDLAPRVSIGMYVGTGNRNSDVFVMTERGIMKGNSIHRRPPDDQFKHDQFDSLRGLPWRLQEREHGGLRIALPDVAAPRERPAVQEVIPRNLYVTKNDLEKHGHTPLCPGCEAAILEMPSRAHNAECRQRIQIELDKTPEGQERIKRARERVAQGRRPRGAAAPPEGGGAEGGEATPPVVPGGEVEQPVLQDRVPLDAEMDASEAVGEPLVDTDFRGELRQREQEREGSPKRQKQEQSRGEKRSSQVDVEDLYNESSAQASGSAGPPAPDASSGVPEGAAAAPTSPETNQEMLHLCSLLKDVIAKGKVAEIFSPPRVAAQAQVVGLAPGFSIDLETKRGDGTHWDLSKDEHIRDLFQLLDYEKPEFLGGSPPCGPFSKLQNIVDAKGNVSPEVRAQRLKDGRKHLRTAVSAYEHQMNAGRYFYHEHPKGAASWEERAVKRLRADERVYEVTGPMCRWGMKAADGQGEGSVKKETTWLTNSPILAQTLQGCCSNKEGKVWHRHVHLVDGRARAAQKYPPKLVHAILKAIRRQLECDGELHSLSHGPVPDAGPVINEEEEFWKQLPDSDDTIVEPVLDAHSGAVLDVDKVRAARQEELAWVHKQGIYIKVPLTEAQQSGKPVITMKWIDRNKGDATHPNYRSRLVCREIKRASNADFIPDYASFSSMPPLESLKLLLSLMVTLRRSKSGNALKVRLLDISRAHFYGEAERDIFVQLPEGDRQEGFCGKLVKSMYGTRDASAIWQRSYTELLIRAGFAKNQAWPSCFYHEGYGGIRVLVHGDDFVVLADDAGQKYLEDTLRSKYDLRVDGSIGPGERHQQFAVLNRIVTYNEQEGSVSYEADPRHVDQMVRDLEMENCKPVKTPSEKMSATEANLKLTTPTITPDRVSFFRSLVMRASYVAQDRPDIAEAVKCLSRRMHEPKESDFQDLKRLVRFLKGKPRVLLKFGRQKFADTIHMYVDSDFAGCLLTRRSTSGLVATFGRHTVKASSTLQSTISLSSGEAEYYSIVRGVSIGMSLQEILRGWGLQPKLKVHTDSSAALGTCNRQGLGRSRHVQTRFLWVQEKLALHEFELVKIPTKQNVADLCTKGLPANEMERHMQSMGFEYSHGRAEAAKALE